jgi:hypothetical protein
MKGLALATIWLVVVAGGLLTGCAAHTQQAVRAADRITALAASSQARFERIAEMSQAHSARILDRTNTRVVEADSSLTSFAKEAALGADEQRAIQVLASEARQHIANTRDNTSPWAEALRLWGLVFFISLVVLGLAYLGVAPLLRRMLK